MARRPGNLKYPQNIEPLSKLPLDARTVVDTPEELITEYAGNNYYPGMLVTVVNNGDPEIYILRQEPESTLSLSDWKKVDSSKSSQSVQVNPPLYYQDGKVNLTIGTGYGLYSKPIQSQSGETTYQVVMGVDSNTFAFKAGENCRELSLKIPESGSCLKITDQGLGVDVEAVQGYLNNTSYSVLDPLYITSDNKIGLKLPSNTDDGGVIINTDHGLDIAIGTGLKRDLSAPGASTTLAVDIDTVFSLMSPLILNLINLRWLEINT